LKSAYCTKVKFIGFQAFWSSRIEQANFPEVEEIGYSAFEDCKNLKSISCPKVRIIDSTAFYRSGLTPENQPKCVT
jgi:hypothetical protein